MSIHLHSIVLCTYQHDQRRTGNNNHPTRADNHDDRGADDNHPCPDDAD
jgi:hypothetical protein